MWLQTGTTWPGSACQIGCQRPQAMARAGWAQYGYLRKEGVSTSELRPENLLHVYLSLCTCVLTQPWSIGQGSEGMEHDRGTMAASNLLDICISVDTNTFCNPLNRSGAVCREGSLGLVRRVLSCCQCTRQWSKLN